MLTTFSSQIADIAERAAADVVQVRAAGGAASAIVYGDGLVLTTGRALGRDEHPEIRTADGAVRAAEIAGWDPASRLALLKADGITSAGLRPAESPKPGHVVIALGRSWSNTITVTSGLVSIIGGPLRTGRRRQLERVFRISAPVHDGFAGGAALDSEGRLLGIVTGAAIRGLTVVIPADIAWRSAAAMLERGRQKRGYLGIAAQPVSVPSRQQTGGTGAESLLIVGVKDGSPADTAGLLVGDLLLALDGVPLSSADDLLELLAGDRVGRDVALRVARGGSIVDVPVRVAER